LDSSDIFTNTLRSALDVLDRLVAVKEGVGKIGERTARELTDEDSRLRRRLRSRLKFTGLDSKKMRQLLRLQARILIPAWDGDDIIDACDACDCAEIDEWRVRAVFEEIIEREANFVPAFFHGLTDVQRYELKRLWIRRNLPVPPKPEQNDRIIARCRELGINEWRIALAGTRLEHNGY